ncbi:MAG: hypothetical protein IIB58_08025, partial [Planctomycetes bacterium]|nr:hypothetical protein [Planctomycetota bacterium]
MRVTSVLLGVWCLLGLAASTLAGEFIPGHVYVSVEEFEVCDFGGQEAILEIDPVTGETSIFADSSDGICAASGLAFTPDSAHLRLLNAGHLFPGEEGWLGWVQEFDPTGASTIPLDASDGLQMPFGYNGLDYDEAGNFYLVNAFESTILRFPADGGPGEVFADEDDGIYGRGAIDFDPISGDLFYTGDLADVILRITPAGDASVFDLPPNSEFLQTLAFDRVGNLFVAGFGHDGPHGSEYAVYRYDNADPGTRRLLVSGFTNPCCSASFPTALTVSPDDTQLYYAVGDVFAPGGFLYSIDPNDGSWVILADFSVFTDFFVMPTGIAVYDPPLPASCEGDANEDGTVDPLDSGFILARFGCPWAPGDPECYSADQNPAGAVDP